MAKEAFYFTHDYGSRNDPKLQKVLMKLGHEGKSVYWDLVEMLYEEGGYLELCECENYAFALRTNPDCIANLVKSFDLFKSDGKNFWSESVLRRLDKRDEKSKKASASAKTRWDKANASKNNANASENDAIKEKKGDKEKEIVHTHSLDKKRFVPPSLTEWRSYFSENGYREDVADRSWKGYDVADWHNTAGKKIKNWKQTAINVWFKDDNKSQQVSPQRKMVY